MGDYTQFELDVDLTDVGILEANKLESWMKTQSRYWYSEDNSNSEYISTGEGCPVYPYSDHEFFRNSRVTWIISNREHEACNKSAWTLVGNHLSIRTSLKNYNDTVEQFLDWLSPLCIPESVNGYTLCYGYENILEFKDGLIQPKYES